MTTTTPNTAGPAAAVPGGPKTLAHVLGEIVWLMTQSPLHRQLFVSDLEWFCLPAVMLEQYRIFHGPETPAGVALWAWVSDETDARLRQAGAKLRADEWAAGDNPWLVELIAPFGAEEEILADLVETVFQGRPFKFLRTTSKGERSVAIFEPQPGEAH